LGRGGAPETPVGVDPGAGVVAKGFVAALGSFDTIEDKGTAVGFVACNETDGMGNVLLAVTLPLAVPPALPLTLTEPVGGTPVVGGADEADELEDVDAWRAST